MDNASFWIVVIAVVALAVTAAALYFIHAGSKGGSRGKMFDAEGNRVRIPLTLPQVRALWGLSIGTAALLWMMVIFLKRGAESYYVQDDMRVSIYLIAFGAALLYGIVHIVTGVRNRGSAKDERDVAVLRWAPTVQVVGMSVTLLAWAIGLTETYWSAGQVPIAYPVLIFFSTLIVGALFQALGVLIGYRVI